LYSIRAAYIKFHLWVRIMVFIATFNNISVIVPVYVVAACHIFSYHPFHFDFQCTRACARGTDHPLFSNFLLTNLFSIKFLYFFIISSLFPYFNLFVSIFIQSYVSIKLHVSTLLDTNNTEGMQLGRFKSHTPARFEYIYCTLFPLCHST
jgi:hypothetical protein